MNEFEYTDAFAPDSTAIKRVAYNANSGDLLIKFTNGNERIYRDVEYETFEDFLGAGSAGRFYNFEIMGAYTSVPTEETALVRVDETEAEDTLPTPATYTFEVKDIAPSGPSDRILDGIFQSLTTTLDTATIVTPSRYSVKWSLLGTSLGGQPEFTANSESEALDQFYQAIEQFLGEDVAVKIQAVTHYFE